MPSNINIILFLLRVRHLFNWERFKKTSWGIWKFQYTYTYTHTHKKKTFNWISVDFNIKGICNSSCCKCKSLNDPLQRQRPKLMFCWKSNNVVFLMKFVSNSLFFVKIIMLFLESSVHLSYWYVFFFLFFNGPLIWHVWVCKRHKTDIFSPF